MAAPEWFSDVAGTGELLAVADDELPLTMLLAEFGEVFAEHVDELTPGQRRQVLGTLERVLTEGGEADRAAVATGFLEALLEAWDTGLDLRLIWEDLGPRSRSHCLSWNEFSGVTSPAWMTAGRP